MSDIAKPVHRTFLATSSIELTMPTNSSDPTTHLQTDLAFAKKYANTKSMRIRKILVDIRHENSFGVTLVTRLAPLDHHFFLDFIFQ